MSAGTNMKLIWGSGSPPCIKVMMVLAEKELFDSCTKKQIQFSEKEHKSDEVLALNPRGQVPTFKDGDIVINESIAICNYLEEASKTNPLIPSERKERAKVLQYMYEVSNISKNVGMPVFYYMMTNKKEDWDVDLLKKNSKVAHDELMRWDGYLNGKKYLVGTKFTMADVFLYTDLAILSRQDLDLNTLYPNLYRFYSLVKARPSAVKSLPPHWSEGAGNKLLADFAKLIE